MALIRQAFFTGFNTFGMFMKKRKMGLLKIMEQRKNKI